MPSKDLDLQKLDDHLVALAASSGRLRTREEILQRREDAARAIILYTRNIERLKKQNKELGAELEQNLAAHKKKFSLWWDSAVKILQNDEVPGSIPSDRKDRLTTETEATVVSGLRQLKKSIMLEVERLEVAEAVLEESSEHITLAQNAMLVLSYGLATAHKLLGGLQRRASKDSSYVFWAFVFFVAVCGWIVGKRLRLWRTVFWILPQLWRIVKILFYRPLMKLIRLQYRPRDIFDEPTSFQPPASLLSQNSPNASASIKADSSDYSGANGVDSLMTVTNPIKDGEMAPQVPTFVSLSLPRATARVQNLQKWQDLTDFDFWKTDVCAAYPQFMPRGPPQQELARPMTSLMYNHNNNIAWEKAAFTRES